MRADLRISRAVRKQKTNMCCSTCKMSLGGVDAPTGRARLDYYIGSTARCRTNLVGLQQDYNTPFVFTCTPSIFQHPATRSETRFFRPYWLDMVHFCNKTKGRHAVQFGDRPPRAYALSKSRFISRRCAMLLPFNRDRHWKDVRVPAQETPWHNKKEDVVWRGVTTGAGLRQRYVHTLADTGYNVHFNAVVQHRRSWIRLRHKDLAPSLTRSDLLKYKYVLSLPGNDVATNLKWLMSHKSVVVMPRPQVEGWLMEGLLKPYVHYVPIDNPRDMNKTITWMRENDEACRRIVRNANAWIRDVLQFDPYVSQIMSVSRAALHNRTIIKRGDVSRGVFD
jgi:hypothetical protein